MVRALSDAVAGCVLWLPIKVAKHYLSPVTDMLDSLAQMTNDEIDNRIKENPL